MDYIIQYLLNPLETGVHYGHFVVDFSLLGKFVGDVAAAANMYESESRELKEVSSGIKNMYYVSNLDRIKENFSKAAKIYARLKECPKGMAEYVIRRDSPVEHADVARGILGMGMRMGITFFSPEYMREPKKKSPEILESHILRDINDVIVIDTEETPKSDVLSFEVTTIEAKGLSRFHNFLKCIPHIGNTIREIQKRKTHSSRYVFRPYPLAVRLWLGSEKSVRIQEDLKDFLKGSIRYHSEKEWRTSIVLSAIAIESILADLYEEQYKEYAPSVPLGDLFHKVRDKMKFPPKIQEAIETVNEARIAAVHRSRFPVSDREATNALCGTATVIMWYSSVF